MARSHGTVSNYVNGRCRCGACRLAMRRWRRRRAGLSGDGMTEAERRKVTAKPHGKGVAKYNKGCRCEKCKEAIRRRQAQYRRTGSTVGWSGSVVRAYVIPSGRATPCCGARCIFRDLAVTKRKCRGCGQIWQVEFHSAPVASQITGQVVWKACWVRLGKAA